MENWWLGAYDDDDDFITLSSKAYPIGVIMPRGYYTFWLSLESDLRLIRPGRRSLK